MSKRWNRTETWVGLAVLALGALLAGIFGVFMYMSATAIPLHPDPLRVPSEARAAPSTQWSDAVARGRQVMRDGLSAQNLPGLSVAVGIDGDIVWAEGFGWADLERRVAVSPHHQFRIGTASTVLTSAAAGLLVERGRLNLDEVIQTYVPEFPARAEPVTVRQLMGHLSGVRTDGGDEGPLFAERCERPADALPFFAERPLLFEPGTQYRYSSYGWILVSAAIEAAAGEPFLTFMREQVFEPLRMDDTRADAAAKPPDAVTPYFPDSRPIRAMARTGCGRSTTPATPAPAPFCRPRPTWSDSGWRSSAARCCSRPPSNCCRRRSDCPRARRRVTGWAGTSRPSRWRERPRPRPATTATRWAGGWRRS